MKAAQAYRLGRRSAILVDATQGGENHGTKITSQLKCGFCQGTAFELSTKQPKDTWYPLSVVRCSSCDADPHPELPPPLKAYMAPSAGRRRRRG